LLGVAADAGPAQVARAYRSQARRLHPDVSLEPNATERFWALEAAYHLALGAAGDAQEAVRGNATTAPPAPAPTATPNVRGLRASTSGDRRRVAWLAAGPVRVTPVRRPVSDATPPSSEGL
jgi:hypothetical protein